jgi:hypothetical protein
MTHRFVKHSILKEKRPNRQDWKQNASLQEVLLPFSSQYRNVCPLSLEPCMFPCSFFSADYPLSLIICEVVFKPEQASDLPGESFESLQRLSQTC